MKHSWERAAALETRLSGQILRYPCNKGLTDQCLDVADAVLELDELGLTVERVEIGSGRSTIHLLQPPRPGDLDSMAYAGTRREHGETVRYGFALFRRVWLEWRTS